MMHQQAALCFKS